MSTNRIPVLSVKLARLAVDVDEVAQQIIAEPPCARDELSLSLPTAHLAIALEWLEQAMYERQRLDAACSWPRRRSDARKESDHAHPESQKKRRTRVPGEPTGTRERVLAPLAA